MSVFFTILSGSRGGIKAKNQRGSALVSSFLNKWERNNDNIEEGDDDVKESVRVKGEK